EGGIVREVDRRLGRELERPVALDEPLLQRGQERLYQLLVADEVVVDEVDVAAVAQVVELLQLGQDLGVRLRPRDLAEELDAVTELAAEGAAAAPLDPDMVVSLQLEQVEARRG